MRNLTDEEESVLIVGTIRIAVVHLIRDHGLELGDVLAVAHSEIIAAITREFGGAIAAQCARQAADKVQDLPPREEFDAENPLAAMTCLGSA